MSLDGFATIVREGLTLAVGQTMALQFEMQVSAVGEAITVTGESPLIETSRTETQVRIDDQAIEGLPNNGRNFLNLTLLTPGVAIVQGPDGDELSIGGQLGIHNNVSVDGADFNNPFFGEQRGGQRAAFTFNLDASGDVTVTYGAISATDGLAGVTEGNGAADPGPTDLSAAPSLSAAGTTYEQFDGGNPNDLELEVLEYISP